MGVTYKDMLSKLHKGTESKAELEKAKRAVEELEAEEKVEAELRAGAVKAEKAAEAVEGVVPEEGKGVQAEPKKDK